MQVDPKFVVSSYSVPASKKRIPRLRYRDFWPVYPGGKCRHCKRRRRIVEDLTESQRTCFEILSVRMGVVRLILTFACEQASSRETRRVDRVTGMGGRRGVQRCFWGCFELGGEQWIPLHWAREARMMALMTRESSETAFEGTLQVRQEMPPDQHGTSQLHPFTFGLGHGLWERQRGVADDERAFDGLPIGCFEEGGGVNPDCTVSIIMREILLSCATALHLLLRSFFLNKWSGRPTGFQYCRGFLDGTLVAYVSVL